MQNKVGRPKLVKEKQYRLKQMRFGKIEDIFTAHMIDITDESTLHAVKKLLEDLKSEAQR